MSAGRLHLHMLNLVQQFFQPTFTLCPGSANIFPPRRTMTTAGLLYSHVHFCLSFFPPPFGFPYMKHVKCIRAEFVGENWKSEQKMCRYMEYILTFVLSLFLFNLNVFKMCTKIPATFSKATFPLKRYFSGIMLNFHISF